MNEDVVAAQRRLDSLMREYTERMELVTRRRDEVLAEADRTAKELAERTSRVFERLQDRRDNGWPPRKEPRRPQPVDDDEDFSTQTWLR